MFYLQDTDIDPEAEFPDTHCKYLADHEWAQFDSKKGNTKLYIPEQLLLSEVRYKKQQRKLESRSKRFQQQKEKQASLDVTLGTTPDNHESDSLEQSSQQAKIEELSADLAILQQENIDMKALLAGKETALKYTEQRVSQLQDHYAVVAAELQRMIQEASHLNKEKTLLYRENTCLQEKVQQLQSKMVEQQPKLGNDSDISFWLVSHDEVHSSGQLLGKGGWGSVAVGSFRGQSVAVKELHSSIRSPYYDELLRREISLMAAFCIELQTNSSCSGIYSLVLPFFESN